MVDFDFQRYVERRRGAREAEAREGAHYAYAADLRYLRTLERLKPVKMALEATVRLWRSAARAELLAGAVKATPKEQPLVHALGEKCAERLHVSAPTIYVAVNDRERAAHTLGTDDEAYVVLSGGLVAELTEAELGDVIGRQCGKIQNQHVLPSTALFYLEHFASRYVRWIVSPALVALRAWARRAEVTCDRAGLICTRDVDVSAAALRKTGVDAAYEEALRVFAESEYYRAMLKQPGGMTPEACDDRVAQILKGKGAVDEHDEGAHDEDAHDGHEDHDE
ncbi:MAG TPA: M48 family metallopeptidase [Polyangia bacterium]|nr:M48 family metallopeptidase [Polyangia bacterium]